MKVHVYGIWTEFVVDVPEGLSEERARQEAVGKVKRGEVMWQTPAKRHIAILPGGQDA